MTWQLTVAGLLVGVLVGLTGTGGGSLMTPILVLVLGFDPTVAVGTDIVHGAIFKTVGALRHRSLGTVQARLSGWMLVGSAPMSLAGVATATWLKHTYGPSVASIEGTVLGAALAAGGLGLLAKSRMRLRAAPEGPFVLARRDKLAAFAVGSFGGYVVGLTSIGSGVFFALTLLVVFPLRSKKVVGTDIFHAAGLLWIAGIGHLVAGNVDTGAIPWLLAGSVPGVLLGSQLTLGVSDAALLRGVAVVLVLAGVRLLDSAGALWMLVGAVVSGTAVLIALFGRRVAPAFSRLVVASSVVPWASPGSRHSR